MLSLVALIGAVSVASTAIAVVYMCYMSAERSGWRRLAARFASRDRFHRRRLHLRSAVLNGFAFHGTLSLGVDRGGLLMVPELPVRPFHPPLYLRWQELESQPFARTHSTGLEVTLVDVAELEPELEPEGAQPLAFSLEIDESLRAELFEECEPEWTAARRVLADEAPPRTGAPSPGDAQRLDRTQHR